MNSAPRSIAIVLALVLGTVFLFDLVAWFVVPADLVRFAPSYRKPELLDHRPGQPAMTRGGDPRGYFMADDAMGFDIKPGARMTHEFGEVPSEIFANTLGCFDRNDASALRLAPGGYVYFGGDSFTWGFAEYDAKFATVWEKARGKVAAKCGVPHTGQRAELDKLKRVTQAIGKLPSTVFVGWYVNDPANDDAYPHTTVIGGYMADTVFVQGDKLAAVDRDELRRTVEAGIRELERPLGIVDRIKMSVWVYSLSANIAINAVQVVRAMMAAESYPVGSTPVAGGAARPTSKFGANLYFWHDPGTIKTKYLTDPKTAANRGAIQAWAQHARENGYRLVFLLFPPKDAFDDPDLFGQVRSFLDTQGIEYVDFAQLFKRDGLKASDLYWRTNGHWNANGNRVVGKLLAERY